MYQAGASSLSAAALRYAKMPARSTAAGAQRNLSFRWLALHWSFSSGDRVGYIQKFSKKGWICKTWEGELQMIPVPGALPEKFPFSVGDEAVAQQVNALIGKKVLLKYEQHKGVPTNCFGETEYFVTDIKSTE